MKKHVAVFITALLTLSFTACVFTNGAQSKRTKKEELKKEATQKEESENAEKKVELKLGETWEVDGQWRFTLTSAVLTDERDQYRISQPEAVLYLKYNYENIGYESEYGFDLYFSLDKLMDSGGNMCELYPINPDEIYPQETPIGGKSDGAEAFGLVKAGSPCKLYVEQYDSKGETKYTAIYTIEF